LRTSSPVGRIKLVNPNENELERRPDGLFRLRTGQPAPLNENVRLSTGVLEGSNVSATDQMISMISLARQFEMQIKMMTNAETNDRAATQLLSVN
jgi:flagellar basal-body rod protein FlgF